MSEKFFKQLEAYPNKIKDAHADAMPEIFDHIGFNTTKDMIKTGEEGPNNTGVLRVQSGDLKRSFSANQKHSIRKILKLKSMVKGEVGTSVNSGGVNYASKHHTSPKFFGFLTRGGLKSIPRIYKIMMTHLNRIKP